MWTAHARDATAAAPLPAALVACGAAWEVLYVDSLTGVQFADPERSGFMTGLFFSGTLGGVTLGALAVGSLFDTIGVGWGLTV